MENTCTYLPVNTHILLHRASTICLHSQNILQACLKKNALQETLPSLGLPIFCLRFGLSKTLQTIALVTNHAGEYLGFCLHSCDMFVVKVKLPATSIHLGKVTLGSWSDRMPSREFLYDFMGQC